MRVSTIRKLSIAALLAVIVGVAYMIWFGLNLIESTVGPRYALEWTSLFIVQHMEENDGQWPTGWADLRDEFDDRSPDSYAWSFEELQTLIDVRWDISLPQDRELFADESFRVIELPDSNDFRHRLESDLQLANREIRDYVYLGKLSQWQRDNRAKRKRGDALNSKSDSPDPANEAQGE